MTTVDTVAPTGTTPTAARNRLDAPADGAAIRSDFDTFLKMLTTQLQNQDPLNPMDSSEFAMQLATFSGVEQQMKTNTLLEGLSGQLDVMGLSDLAGWIGKRAQADMPVWFVGEPIDVEFDPDPLATSADLVTHDASGTEVGREAVDPGTATHLWTGLMPDGTPLPVGRYTLTLESFSQAGLIGTSPVESYGRIIEARKDAVGTMLVFAGGIEVSADKVTALGAD